MIYRALTWLFCLLFLVNPVLSFGEEENAQKMTESWARLFSSYKNISVKTSGYSDDGSDFSAEQLNTDKLDRINLNCEFDYYNQCYKYIINRSGNCKKIISREEASFNGTVYKLLTENNLFIRRGLPSTETFPSWVNPILTPFLFLIGPKGIDDYQTLPISSLADPKKIAYYLKSLPIPVYRTRPDRMVEAIFKFSDEFPSNYIDDKVSKMIVIIDKEAGWFPSGFKLIGKDENVLLEVLVKKTDIHNGFVYASNIETKSYNSLGKLRFSFLMTTDAIASTTAEDAKQICDINVSKAEFLTDEDLHATVKLKNF
jgi:hypothetical protein